MNQYHDIEALYFRAIDEADATRDDTLREARLLVGIDDDAANMLAETAVRKWTAAYMSALTIFNVACERAGIGTWQAEE